MNHLILLLANFICVAVSQDYVIVSSPFSITPASWDPENACALKDRKLVVQQVSNTTENDALSLTFDNLDNIVNSYAADKTNATFTVENLNLTIWMYIERPQAPKNNLSKAFYSQLWGLNYCIYFLEVDPPHILWSQGKNCGLYNVALCEKRSTRENNTTTIGGNVSGNHREPNFWTLIYIGFGAGGGAIIGIILICICYKKLCKSPSK